MRDKRPRYLPAAPGTFLLDLVSDGDDSVLHQRPVIGWQFTNTTEDDADSACDALCPGNPALYALVDDSVAIILPDGRVCAGGGLGGYFDTVTAWLDWLVGEKDYLAEAIAIVKQKGSFNA